ncbi:SH3 beta-barrel fold-containing protein [Lepagella muris]|uniref:DUF2693 domain-containing protein n=1 Tax=Lepagella muris TaxID=3032870 RepID=A0AC61RNK4_9BACT|nr:SH3 beta-barrel fold-containing protein [Lepagella muris]ROT06828.1 DUF2693 domain-containing protein [Muribaculaceae bacterium Isolate-037 (Harlan)]TGY80955.1 DUF2693 domain-containing protein [Lepagella muris]THG54033.1 DUF2693 domain-containing protein [Bacteroidales bacterium]TKC56712.1 DUF2693 domain-containing protein [Bacteroidales bacterium]
MSNERKSTLANIMRMAWMFVKRNGFTMAEALKVAWLNAKVTKAMRTGIVQFFFMKVDGTLRQAFGTLDPHRLPETQGSGRRPADTVQVYYDTEKQEYRSFKKCNLYKMA